MSEARSILHVDMDAFFASIEQLDDPSLRGKPVLVGHDGPRGVVTAASYEARPFGCRSAQPMAAAKRLCPQAVVVPVRGSRYREVSERMFAILERFSPVVEPLSVDEAFLDLTGTHRLLGPPEEVAARLKSQIWTELGLTASIGLAPNKHLAKLASDMRKPDGLMIIREHQIDEILLSLSVAKLWGIGRVTAERLARLGITTINDLRLMSLQQLEHHFGSEAEWYFNVCRGIDHRKVTPDREAKSIGHEQTFGVNLTEPEDVRRVLLDQVEQVAERLRRHHLYARGLSLKIRYRDFHTITRSCTLPKPSQATAVLWESARQTFDDWTFEPVRLIGCAADRLTPSPGQLNLFDARSDERNGRLDQVADKINGKFGKRSIRRGGG